MHLVNLGMHLGHSGVSPSLESVELVTMCMRHDELVELIRNRSQTFKEVILRNIGICKGDWRRVIDILATVSHLSGVIVDQLMTLSLEESFKGKARSGLS